MPISWHREDNDNNNINNNNNEEDNCAGAGKRKTLGNAGNVQENVWGEGGLVVDLISPVSLIITMIIIIIRLLVTRD